MKRKILSIVLSLAMVFTMMPAMGAAAFAETEGNYLTFTAGCNNSSVTFNWKNGSNVQYKASTDENWTNYTAGTEIPLDEGDSVQFKGEDVITNYLDHFSMTGKIAASGSVTSLTDETGTDPEVKLAKGCYSFMFCDCSSLTSAPELPAENLEQECYYCMFGCMDDGCTSLTSAPELPATTLAKECYSSMFCGCTSLTSAPELPATVLAEECYYDMFYDCTGLTNAPELPATELEKGCYEGMFAGCTGIRMYLSYSVNHASKWSIPEGATTAEDWNAYMFTDTGGEFQGDPEPGTVYYQSKPDPVSSVKLSKTTCTYTGKTISPSVTVKTASGKTLTKGTDYTVAYKNNKKVGKATVTVNGIGDYKGTITKTFKINPKKAAVSKATPGKKKLTVKIGTKVSSTGGSTYQIAYKQKGTSKWKYTTTTKQSKVIKKLKKGKRYYVKVRAYKTVSKVNYYSAWSKQKLSKAERFQT